MKVITSLDFMPFILLIFFSFCGIDALTWKEVLQKENIYLYAGSIGKNIPQYKTHIGVAINKNASSHNHVMHDITKLMPIPDNCIDIYQSEDVFEHIEYEKLVFVINDIYRVLKPNGLLRVSVPDYRFDINYQRAEKDRQGNIVFDYLGGGRYVNGKVVPVRGEQGHVWFPVIETVRELLERTDFAINGKINYLYYYDAYDTVIAKPIDYSKGFVWRAPPHNKKEFSIIVAHIQA